MKIKIELNGVNVSREIPISWSEVTFSQFLQLSEADNDLAKRLAIFTGITPETLKKASIKNLDSILNLLSFIDKQEIEMSVIPKKIAVYDMPDNLGLQSIAQFEDLKLEAAKLKDGKSLKVYATFCAIYATNPYDWTQAESKIEAFMNAPCGEVLAIGNFTLARLIESNNPLLKEALKPPSRMKKLKLAMNGWLSRLVFTARYYSWRRKLRIKGTSS